MHSSDILLGQLYRGQLHRRVTIVRLLTENPAGGWDAIDIATGNSVRIESANRLLCRCDRNGRAIETGKPTGRGRAAG